MSEPRHSEALGRKLMIGKAGLLVFYPPAGHGQPSAATITLRLVGGGALPTPVSGAAMTRDTVSTGINGNPARGDESFVVDSATGITVGRSYVLETAGQRERVLVRSLSGTTVGVASGLRLDHTDATTVKGHRCAYTVIAGNTATAGRDCHAAVAWTDEDGTVHDGGFAWHIVRQPWRLWITDEDVLRSWPAADVQRQVRDRDEGFGDEIAEAAEEIALRHMRPAGYYEDRFLDPQPFGNLAILLIRRMLVERLHAHDPERLTALSAHWQGLADAEWERLAKRLPAYDADDDGIIDATGERDVRELAALHLPESQETVNPAGLDADEFLPRFRRNATSTQGRTQW